MWTLFIALVFAGLYEAVAVDYGDHPTFLSSIYYSVVTFTTLGFGDITPRTPTAAVAVMIEVVVGYLMLGILISILANKVARRS